MAAFLSQKQSDAFATKLKKAGLEVKVTNDEVIGYGDSKECYVSVSKKTDTKFSFYWSFRTENIKNEFYSAFSSSKDYPEKYMKRDEDKNLSDMLWTLDLAISDFQKYVDFAKKHVKKYDLITMFEKELAKSDVDINDIYGPRALIKNIGDNSDFRNLDATKIYPTGDSLLEVRVYIKELTSNASVDTLNIRDLKDQAFDSWSRLFEIELDKNNDKISLNLNSEYIEQDLKCFRDIRDGNKELKDIAKRYQSAEAKIYDKMVKELATLYKDFAKEVNRNIEVKA